MNGVTVTVRLSAESAAFMRKCIGDVQGGKRDAFIEAAIAALAEALLDHNDAVPSESD